MNKKYVLSQWKLSIIAITIIILPMFMFNYVDNYQKEQITTPVYISPIEYYKAYGSVAGIGSDFDVYCYEDLDNIANNTYADYDYWDNDTKTLSLYQNTVTSPPYPTRFTYDDFYRIGLHIVFEENVKNYTFNINYYAGTDETDLMQYACYLGISTPQHISMYFYYFNEIKEFANYDYANNEGYVNLTFNFEISQETYEYLVSREITSLWFTFKFIIDNNYDNDDIWERFTNVTIMQNEYITPRIICYEYMVIGTGIVYIILGLYMTPIFSYERTKKLIRKIKWW